MSSYTVILKNKKEAALNKTASFLRFHKLSSGL